MLIAAASLSAAYFALIFFFLRHWRAFPIWDPGPAVPAIRISILVPARNEAETIESCLRSLIRQNYPADLLEIIVIDDHSEDGTPERVQELGFPRVRLLKLEEAGLPDDTLAFKKHALQLGVRESTGDLILCTDADCVCPPDWARQMASLYERSEAVFIAGPVGILEPESLLERFQALDFLGTSLISGSGCRAGAFHLANGANLGFDRKAFEAVKGYRGIDHLASGDDMLLLQKLKAAYPDRITYLKNPDAVVRTRAMPDWDAFIGQRLRWASKSAAYRDQTVTWIWALVFLVSVLLLALLLFFPIAGPGWRGAALMLAAAKGGGDAWLLLHATAFTRERALMRAFMLSQCLHLVYVPWVAVKAFFARGYVWKGRRVR